MSFEIPEALSGVPRRVDDGLPLAVQLRNSLLAGEVSAGELAHDVAERVRSKNPDLNAVVTWDEDMLLAQAREADDALAGYRDSSGSPADGANSSGSDSTGGDSASSPAAASAASLGKRVPPLLGLPMGLKDGLDIAGLPTTYGSAAMDHVVAGEDGLHAARLRSAGANLFAKTSVPEFLLSCHSENPILPPAKNPLDVSRTPGGSSGGSAAAVAGGLMPVAPGSDGGGSVRIPASATGLIGLKLGRGAMVEDITDETGAASPIDRWGAPKLSVTGPLGRDARDAALMLDGLLFDRSRLAAGHSATPALDSVEAALDHSEGLAGLHVGFTRTSAFDSALPVEISAAAEAAFARACAVLERLGADIEESPWQAPSDYDETFRKVWTAWLGRTPIPYEDKLGELAASFRAEAQARSENEQERANERLLEIGGSMSTAWGSFDVVVTPAMAETPPPLGYFTDNDAETDYRLQCLYTPYTSMVNVTGVPAVTVPVGWTPDGFSMSAQLIGRMGSEVHLLCIAALMQRELASAGLI